MDVNVIQRADPIWTLMSPKGGDPIWTLNVTEGGGDPIWALMSSREVTAYGH